MPQTLQDYLEALRAVILAHHPQDSAHEPSATEYFALIATTLASGAESVSETMPMLLKVLSAVLPSASPAVLRAQFKPVAHTLVAIAKQYGMDREQPGVLASVLVCIGKLLCAQETSEVFWTSAPALQAVNALLAFVDDETEAVRRAAHEALVVLLAQHALHQSKSQSHTQTHTQSEKGLRSYFADFTLGVFQAASRASYKRAFAVVVLLESALISLSERDVRRIADAAQRLHRCEIPRLSVAVYRTLDALLQNTLYTMRCSAELTAHVLQSLAAATHAHSGTAGSNTSSAVAAAPSGPNRDVETHCFLCSALASALLVLRKQDLARAWMEWESVLHALCGGAESEYVQVHVSVSAAIKRCVSALFGNDLSERARQREVVREVVLYQRQCVSRGEDVPADAKNVPSDPNAAAKNVPQAVRALRVTVVALERLLALKYTHAWVSLLDCVRALCESVRETEIAEFVLTTLVRRLCEVETAREREVCSLTAEVVQGVRDTLGAALHALSLPVFLSLCPVVDSEASANKLVLREWVLDLLAYELKNLPGRLSDFYTSVLPVIEKILALAVFLANQPGKEGAVSLLRGKIVRLWALLPEMCHGRVLDVATAFPRFKDVTSNLFVEPFSSELPEASFSVVIALGRVAKHVKQSGTAAERALCESESAHYVSLLLRYCEALRLGDGRCTETLGALSQWLSLSPEMLVAAVSRKLLQLVLQSTHDMLSPAQSGENKKHDVSAQSERTAEVAVYMAVLHAIIPFLSPNLALVVYKTIRPLLSLDNALSMQKRAYSLLYTLLLHHRKVVLAENGQTGAESEREGVVSLLTALAESLLTTHVSARALRLKCISLVLSPPQTHTQTLLSDAEVEAVLGEVLLSQRDSNKKTRDEAAQILRTLALRTQPIGLFTRLCAALVGETAAMRAAAAQAIASVLLTHRDAQRERERDARMSVDSDDESAPALSDEEEENGENEEAHNEEADGTALPHSTHTHTHGSGAYNTSSEEYTALLRHALSLLPSLSLLLSQESAEQTKSALSLLKTLVSLAPLDDLVSAVPLLLHASCTLTGSLKAKNVIAVRAIVRRLSKRVSVDDLRPHMPASDVALLDYVAREKRKQARKKNASSAADKERRAGSVYDALLRDRDDSDDDSDDQEGSVHERRSHTHTQTRANTQSVLGDGEREDYRFQKRRLKATLAPRSVVDAREEREREGERDNEDDDEIDERLTLSLSRRKRQRQERLLSASSVAPSALAMRAQSVQQAVRERAAAGSSGDNEPFEVVVDAAGKVSVRAKAVSSLAAPAHKGFTPSVASALRRETGSQLGGSVRGAQKKENTKKRRAALREPGAEYRAKKAGGDVWKKGVALQPHAYIPLDPRLLSKKNTAQAVDHFGVVVDSAKNNRRKVKVMRRK